MDARKQVAASVSVEPSEIVFVSGGSEANNVATTGVLSEAGKDLRTVHAITSAVEHPCVLEPLRFLQERQGLQLTVLPVDAHGRVSLSTLVAAIKTNTALISVMAANNETGAVQPVREFADWLNLARWTKPRAGQNWRESLQAAWPEWSSGLSEDISQQHLQGLHFHVDAVQAWGKIPTASWLSQGFDSASLCAHKIGGLAGVGALILRRGRKFQPLIRGGAQERSRRAGTENLMGILSLGLMAQKLQSPAWWDAVAAMSKRKDRLLNQLSEWPQLVLNTPFAEGLPNTVNFSVDGKTQKGEDILLELDMRGFYASSGSACSSAANRPSHVLLAQHSNAALASNAIRVSLSTETTDSEIDALLLALGEIFKSR
jgi:cysteine desulfurase